MPVPYFSAENLIGAAKSIAVGAALYVLQYLVVMHKGSYPEKWPKKLDLEDLLYRPLIRVLIVLGGAFAALADRLPDWMIAFLTAFGTAVARICSGFGDGVVLGLRKRALSRLREKQPAPVGNRLTYALGTALDKLAAFMHNKPVSTHYESVLAALKDETSIEFKKVTKSISFGLFMFCAGLLATLIWLLWL